ncbi:SPOR domain-containing protein [Qipengyuania sp. G39]|uniref:SPOR domain-containing protein n=1 Tax=Qipengyuania profundimaris TaxID=3067652 RepID=A0ABT9HQ40_9SPHN|nr:SPOR domain-containing protein [Qipengyuania sp. G39]MDP4575260.1 SPOR domain-containing protein [Qipengyuania sp. G39]
MKLRDRFGIFFAGLVAGAAAMPLAAHAQDGEALTGPAADYPIVLGEPYMIDGETFTPVDTMNYDRVGYVSADEDGSGGVTGAHKTLPLPSYVEVTSLETGRTILVRLERRGPMTTDRLLALSPGALVQLGASNGTPIRVRRVNPPEDHRAMLRQGGGAPLRMDTPASLVEVLKRRLPDAGSASLRDPRQDSVSGREPDAASIAAIDPSADLAKPPLQSLPVDAEADVNKAGEQADAGENPEPMAQSAEDENEPADPDLPKVDGGRFVVQLGAFSVRDNAERLAEKVEGFIISSGSLSLVRIGPFASREKAAQALAKLRSEGYRDALIQTAE